MIECTIANFTFIRGEQPDIQTEQYVLGWNETCSRMNLFVGDEG